MYKCEDTPPNRARPHASERSDPSPSPSSHPSPLLCCWQPGSLTPHPRRSRSPAMLGHWREVERSRAARPRAGTAPVSSERARTTRRNLYIVVNLCRYWRDRCGRVAAPPRGGSKSSLGRTAESIYFLVRSGTKQGTWALGEETFIYK